MRTKQWLFICRISITSQILGRGGYHLSYDMIFFSLMSHAEHFLTQPHLQSVGLFQIFWNPSKTVWGYGEFVSFFWCETQKTKMGPVWEAAAGFMAVRCCGMKVE